MSWLVLTCSDCRAGRCVSTWEHATHVTSTSAGNFRVSDGGFVVACLGIVNCRNVSMTCNDHRPACFVWRNLLSPGGSKDSIMPPIWDAFARAVNVEEPDETTLRFPWVFIVLGIPRGPLGSASNALKARTEVLSVWVRAFTLWKSVAAKRWKNTTEKPTNVRLVDIAHTNPWDWYIHLHKNHNQSNVGKYTIHGWYGLIHMVCWNTVVERAQNTLVEWCCNHQSCEFPARVVYVIGLLTFSLAWYEGCEGLLHQALSINLIPVAGVFTFDSSLATTVRKLSSLCCLQRSDGIPAAGKTKTKYERNRLETSGWSE